MALEVYTARLGYRGPLRWLDISLQGNLRRAEQGHPGGQDGIGLHFAPSPDLLYPYLSKRKWGRLSDADWPRFVGEYTALMRRRFREMPEIFWRLGAMDKVVLLCFEQAGEPCHRLILADILVKLGATYQGEVEVAKGARAIPAPGETIIGQGDGCLPAVTNVGTHTAPEFAQAIICRPRGRRKSCRACGSGQATKLCDFPLAGSKTGKTCDMDLCDRCATRIADEVDYCPVHARLAKEALPLERTP